MRKRGETRPSHTNAPPRPKILRLVVVDAEYRNPCMVSGARRVEISKAPEVGLMNRECGRRPLASASASVGFLAGGSGLSQP
jgi:hypothetical protein